MAPKDLFGFFGRLRIKGDNGFEEVSEQKIIHSETGRHVLTPIFGKTGQGKAADENRVQSAE
jgi:hypothetical protein